MSFGLWAQMAQTNHVLDGGSDVLRDVAMTTSFRKPFAITGFVWTTASGRLVTEGVWVSTRQSADIADNLQVREVAMSTIFWQTFAKPFTLCYETVVCALYLSVSNIDVLWPNGLMDQDDTWYGGMVCVSPSLTHLYSGFSTSSPSLPIAFSVLSIHCIAWGLCASFLYKSRASYSGSLRQHGFLVLVAW